MKKSLMLLTMSALIGMLALSGCGSNETEKPAEEPPKTEQGTAPKVDDSTKKVENFEMVIRHTNVLETSKPTLKVLEEVAAKTQEEVPGLKFKLDGVDDTTNRDVKLKAEMQAGIQPPIFNLFGGADTITYSQAGRLLPLNDILTEIGLGDAFLNLDSFTVDGKIYGLPESGFVEGFFYNKKIFAEAGVEVPKTWDEVYAVSEKIKEKGYIPIAMGAAGADGWVPNMILNNLFIGLGGPDLQKGFKTGESKWTDPAVVGAFQHIRDLVEKGYIDKNALGIDYAAGQANFYTGKAGMIFDGSWAIGGFTGDTSKIKDDIGFFRNPDIGGPGDGYINAGFSNGYGFSANLKDNELEAVKAFIKNYYSKDNQKRLMIEISRIPSMKGITDLTGAKELTKSLGESQGTAKGAFPAFDDLVQKEVKMVLEKVVQEVMAGKTTPEDAAKKVQDAQDTANAKKE